MDKWTWGKPANTAISAGRSAADRPRGRLAANGLTYTNFHVNALCSPTRMSLLTGRNQHQCSAATVVDTSTGYPGDTGVRPDSCATIGEIVHRWGYVTSYFGKCHEVPPYEVSVSGPFDRWPARSGFDKFYGYLAGEQSSLHPNLIDGVTHIGTPKDPEYHFNIDMTDQPSPGSGPRGP